MDDFKSEIQKIESKLLSITGSNIDLSFSKISN